MEKLNDNEIRSNSSNNINRILEEYNLVKIIKKQIPKDIIGNETNNSNSENNIDINRRSESNTSNLKSSPFKLNIDFYDEDTDKFNYKFLEIPYLQEQVILPSFYRCGNTLTREVIEGITEIITGSDDKHTNIKYSVLGDKEIPSAHLNFKGNDTVDNKVWIYKTHYPARKGKGVFKFEKILLVIRNPFDAIDSMFNLFSTNSHTDSISEDMYYKYEQEWINFVKDQSYSYNQFYSFWMRLALKNNIPLLIIRYEDLIKDLKNESIKIMKFLLGYQQLNNNFLINKIDKYLLNRKLLYIPRKGTSYHSIKHFSNHQIKEVLKECDFWINFCGYSQNLTQSINEIINDRYITKTKTNNNEYSDFNKNAYFKEENELKEFVNTIKESFNDKIILKYKDIIKNNGDDVKIFVENNLINSIISNLLSFFNNNEEMREKEFFQIKNQIIYNKLIDNISAKFITETKDNIESSYIDINQFAIDWEFLNEFYFSNYLINEVYSYDTIVVPNKFYSKLESCELDSEDLSFDFCNNVESRKTLKILLSDIKNEVDLEKKVDMLEMRKIFKNKKEVLNTDAVKEISDNYDNTKDKGLLEDVNIINPKIIQDNSNLDIIEISDNNLLQLKDDIDRLLNRRGIK